MNVALIGNPNSGKTTVFNRLTGLNQKIGNYPGVTVDKKTGHLKGHKDIEIIDLPGIYSLYPKTKDEEVAYQTLSDPSSDEFPSGAVIVTDASNLERNLLLYTQIIDLRIPSILVLNMSDIARKKGIEIDIEKLSEVLGGARIVPITARTGQGMDNLIQAITEKEFALTDVFVEGEFDPDSRMDNLRKQKNLTEHRYAIIRRLLSFAQTKKNGVRFNSRNQAADKIITHPVYGFLIFIAIFTLIFQAIYSWAEWPMDLIDKVFFRLSILVKNELPEGVLTDLIAEGIIPGLGGVVIFIPQIAILFTFLFILEETGYMARVVFILDRIMRPFGLNGRSAVPLLSGVACAIPAIMATRTIDNWKERMITIMVTPLMSCSARLPVYTLLIALVIPDQMIGPFNIKGLVLLGLYLLGIIAALLFAALFKLIIKSNMRSFLIMELPVYRVPRWSNMGINIWEKTKLFVFEAGKVILAISVILWVLASYGPPERMKNAASHIPVPNNPEMMAEYESNVNAAKLENSYIGILGKGLEPAIEPLGYNWQIGIALITSFAAREVFVGSIATIYSVGDEFEENDSLIRRMRRETNDNTGLPVYTIASGVSLMIFYAFAMQCMSTLAVVLRETKKWKWPIIQLFYMTALAYVAALIAYNLLK